jgi:hypothetical protein
VGEQHRHAGGHRSHRPDDADVPGRRVAAEHLPEVGRDGQPAAVVAAVEADDVAVVGEPGRDRRAAAPVPSVEERGVEGPDLGVLRVSCRHVFSSLALVDPVPTVLCLLRDLASSITYRSPPEVLVQE